MAGGVEFGVEECSGLTLNREGHVGNRVGLYVEERQSRNKRPCKGLCSIQGRNDRSFDYCGVARGGAVVLWIY